MTVDSTTVLRSDFYNLYFTNGTQNVLESVNVTDVNKTAESLNLSNRRLIKITEHAFDQLLELISLDLSSNSLKSLPKNIFENLKNLEYLSLANNNLREIQSVFHPLPKLRVLDIRGNVELKISHPHIFAQLPDDSSIITSKGNFDEIFMPSMFIANDWLQEPLKWKLESSQQKWYKYCIDTPKAHIDKITERDMNKRDCSTIRQVPKNYSDLHPVMMCYLTDADGVIEKVDIASNDLPENCVLLDFDVDFFPDMFTLILSKDNIKGFAKDWFKLPDEYGIQELMIINTAIQEINDNILNDLGPCIQKVQFLGNEIKHIKKNVINNNYIRYLEFFMCEIEKIEDGAFSNMELIELNLDNNHLHDLEFVYNLPQTLHTLSLQSNNISGLPHGVFSCLTNLTELRLSNNKLSVINNSSFEGLFLLDYLDLRSNTITDINVDVFDHLMCVRKINLDHNKIQRIDKGFAKSLNLLRYLHLSGHQIQKFEVGVFYGMPLDSTIVYENNNTNVFQPGMFKNCS